MPVVLSNYLGLNWRNYSKAGISLLTYFGHSSSSTLEFNIDNPQNYENEGKYPMFFALGCNAGSIFNFTTSRFQARETISEKYVLAQDRGTIGYGGKYTFWHSLLFK